MTFDDWQQLEVFLQTVSQQHQERWQSSTGHSAIRFAYPYRDELFGMFFVHNVHESERSWVFIGVRVLPANVFDLAALMKEIPPGPIGALSLANDYLCVSHNLPIHQLHRDDLLATMNELCEVVLFCQERAKSLTQDLAALAFMTD